MKIERINENQIRCTLTNFDLSVRDLNLGELAYGSEKAKKLFREMIQKASNEVGFDAEDIPLMVEAIPLSNESIMLIITKIEDPEELDTRFSKFSPAADDEENGLSLTNELLEGADGLLGLFSKEKDSSYQKETSADNEKKEVSSARFFVFKSLEQVCVASRIAGQAFDEQNTLYKNPKTNRYYLVVKEASPDSDSFKRLCNLLTEYGNGVRCDETVEAYYQEHYEVIVKDKALQVLAKL